MSARTPISARIRILQFSLIVAVSIVSFAALTLPIGLRTSTQALDIGEVAQVTLQSPRDISYVSDIRTGEARKGAESAVQLVYTAPDPAIARQQIERLSTAMQYITSVRDTPDVTNEQRTANLVELSDVRLQLETIDYVISMSTSRWEIVQAESLRVLEQIMRRAIYEEKVEATQAGIASSVSLTLNEQQSDLVTELVTAFVVPNSFYSEELTTAARAAARDAVRPIVQTYKTGETIVPAGKIITPADMEAFQQLGMISPGQRWEDMLGAAAVVILSAVFIPMYFYRRRRASGHE